MAWELVRLQPGHVRRFIDEERTAEGAGLEFLEQPGAAEGLAQFNSWTLLDEDGRVRCLGGTIEQWPSRHLAWLFVGADLDGPGMLRVVRGIGRGVREASGRIETTVREGFEQGHRLVRLLGFEVENPPGRLRGFDPEDGSTHIAYVRFV